MAHPRMALPPGQQFDPYFPKPSEDATPIAKRRLQRDYQKLLEEPLPGIYAHPCESNILEWHYVIEGSAETPYEGGFYHGKIVFASDFPWKPPAICMLTPNGRFRVNVRLCLSISDYHPESWNPGWTVSSILVGLHSFMNENSNAAGVVEETLEVRKRLASESIKFNLAINIGKNLQNPIFTGIFPALAEILRNRPSASSHQPAVSNNPNNSRKRTNAISATEAPPEKKLPGTKNSTEVIDLTGD